MGNRYYPINGKELASVTTITGTMDKSDALIPWAVGLAVDYVGNMMHWIENGAGRLTLDDLQDARTQWRTIRDEAGHIGTMVHDALEEYHEGHDWLIQTLRDEKAHKDPVVKRCAEMAVKLYDAAVEKLTGIGNYRVLGLEVKVYNENEWYAGRFDLLIEVEVSPGVWEIWLIDFKTGGAFYPEWGLQLAAYAEAWDGYTLQQHLNGNSPQVHFIDRIKVLRLDKKTLKAYWKDYSEQRGWLLRAFLGLRDAFYILKAKKAVKQAYLSSQEG